MYACLHFAACRPGGNGAASPCADEMTYTRDAPDQDRVERHKMLALPENSMMEQDISYGESFEQHRVLAWPENIEHDG